MKGDLKFLQWSQCLALFYNFIDRLPSLWFCHLGIARFSLHLFFLDAWPSLTRHPLAWKFQPSRFLSWNRLGMCLGLGLSGILCGWLFPERGLFHWRNRQTLGCHRHNFESDEELWTINYSSLKFARPSSTQPYSLCSLGQPSPSNFYSAGNKLINSFWLSPWLQLPYLITTWSRS